MQHRASMLLFLVTVFFMIFPHWSVLQNRSFSISTVAGDTTSISCDDVSSVKWLVAAVGNISVSHSNGSLRASISATGSSRNWHHQEYCSNVIRDLVALIVFSTPAKSCFSKEMSVTEGFPATDKWNTCATVVPFAKFCSNICVTTEVKEKRNSHRIWINGRQTVSETGPCTWVGGTVIVPFYLNQLRKCLSTEWRQAIYLANIHWRYRCYVSSDEICNTSIATQRVTMPRS